MFGQSINALKKTKNIIFIEMLLLFSIFINFFNIRKIIFFEPVNTTFNEYTSIFLHIGDIFIILLILAFIIIVPRGTIMNFIQNHKIVLTPIIPLIFFGFSTFYSSEKLLSIFWILKIWGFYLFYLILVFTTVSRETFFFNLMKVIIISSIFFSVFGMTQFISQKSLGYQSIGESAFLESTIDGIAKIDIFDQKVVRSYSLFQHPNIFGFFLILSFVNLFLFSKFSKILFHVKHHWNKIIKTSLLLSLISIILTFSKSTLISLILILLLFIVLMRLFHVKQNSKITPITLVIGLIIFVFFLFNLNSPSITDRKILLNNYFQHIDKQTSIFWGSGMRSYMYTTKDIITQKNWEKQPVHNTFLLVFYEAGIFGALSLLILGYFFVRSVFNCSTWNNFTSILSQYAIILIILNVAILITPLLFDHFLWDTHIGLFFCSLSLFYITTGLLILKTNQEVFTPPNKFKPFFKK